MKAQQEIQPTLEAMVNFDRTSTREELFEVIELLCNAGKSEFTRSPDIGETANPSLVGLSEATAELMSDATKDVEQKPNGEMRSLAELLLGQAERPN